MLQFVFSVRRYTSGRLKEVIGRIPLPVMLILLSIGLDSKHAGIIPNRPAVIHLHICVSLIKRQSLNQTQIR